MGEGMLLTLHPDCPPLASETSETSVHCFDSSTIEESRLRRLEGEVTRVARTIPKYVFHTLNSEPDPTDMHLDPQAVQLNLLLKEANPSVYALLSFTGKSIYFPKLGNLSQSAEAAGKAINATAGIALEEDGDPVALDLLADMVRLPRKEIFPYAPGPGRSDLRSEWKRMMLEKNPALRGKPISQPVVCAALTHGLSLAGYLFCDHGDAVIIPDLYWENYDLVFGATYSARMRTYRTFDESGRLDLADFEKQVAGSTLGSRKIVVLNFPNNPTGYSPTVSEAARIVSVLTAAAERGEKVIALIDDAYAGLNYEPQALPHSLFSDLCDAHPNLLAIKIDGATKEDYVWGLRIGFVTFGIARGTPELYQALESKAAGAVRATISNASHLAQSMLVKAWASPRYAEEKRAKFELLRSRYLTVRRILSEHPEYCERFVPLPFNSGYFMCVRPVSVDAETTRKILLRDYSTGVIQVAGLLRIAYSAVPNRDLEKLFENLYRAMGNAT
jgi:aspartate/methionine/tyrosine aminotransferase